MAITYDDIKKANDTIKSMTISRKDKETGEIISKSYAEVNQRIKAFRMVYPTGYINTKMLSNENGVCLFWAEVGFTEGDRNFTLGTGHAFEKEGSSYINKSSHIENCETSAVGRALGMAGFGIDMAVASAEEVQNANQEKPEPKATPKQVEFLKNTYEGENLTKLLKANNIEKLEDMPMKKASELMEKINKGGKQ